VLPDRREVAERWLRWAAEDLVLAEHTATFSTAQIWNK
jgi:hypothetical protein